MSDDKPMTDLDTMKADMAVLAKASRRLLVLAASVGHDDLKALHQDDADAFKRLHDYLSARLADAEQPAVAGDGGLLDAANRETDALIERAGIDIDDHDQFFLDLRDTLLRFAALSTSVPAGVVDVVQEQEAFDHWWETSGRRRSYDVFAEQAAYASWRERADRAIALTQDPTR